MRGTINRRKFIKTAGTTAAALSLPVESFSILSGNTTTPNQRDNPLVAVVRDMSAHSGSLVMTDIAQVMMDEAVRRYTGIMDIGAAYQSVFEGITINDVIGIKVNCINGDLPTHPAMVYALANGLQKMNLGGNPFPANNIIIWDRTDAELLNCGYTYNSGPTGIRCFGTTTAGYNSMFLNCNGSDQHPSNILTDYCDYLVNFAVLKNSNVAGVTLCMKNHYGSIHAPSSMHGGFCNPFTPALNQQIRDALTVQENLFIVDAIFGCYTGGCQVPPNMIYDGLILGGDRVAVDAVGRQILDDHGCPTIYMSGHIDTAAERPYNLGTADLEEIECIEVLNPSDAVENLTIIHDAPDVVLNWSTPEYTGDFKVLRSVDPGFNSYDEIATLIGNTYTDAGASSSSEKFFYRVVKTWG